MFFKWDKPSTTTKKLQKWSNGIIDCNCEFGYELQLVIPYAYYLYTKNLLKQTNCCQLTKELYYFSQHHNELYNKRIDGIKSKINVPNKTPHVKYLNTTEYLPPPYKDIYKNDFFIYDKPLLIIHNKYNNEWNGPPINFINKMTLEMLLEHCHKKYTIIYIRPNLTNIIHDNSSIYNLNECGILNKYNVINGNELYKKTKEKYKINNFNHFQLLIPTNCEKFISVQGGNCVLSSYFGGTNIIYAIKGQELKCGAYNTHYKDYSGCNVIHTDNYYELIKTVKKLY